MKKLLLATCSIAVLFLSGCGNVCSRAESAGDVLYDKIGDCDLQVDQPSNADRERERNSCENSLDSCNDKDIDRLNAYYDCLERVPACVPGSEGSFMGGVIGCISNLSQMSNECQQARARN